MGMGERAAGMMFCCVVSIIINKMFPDEDKRSQANKLFDMNSAYIALFFLISIPFYMTYRYR